MAFSILPNDLYFEIGQCLNLADLRNLSLVNRRLASIGSNDCFWQPLVPSILSKANRSARDLVKLSLNLTFSEGKLWDKWHGKYTRGKFNNYNSDPMFMLIPNIGGNYHHNNLPSNYKLYILVCLWQLKTLARLRVQYRKTELESNELKRYDKTSCLRLLTKKTSDKNLSDWEINDFLRTAGLPNNDYTKFNTLDFKYGTLAIFVINEYHTSVIYFKDLSKIIDELSRVTDILKFLPSSY